jgi:hypothetical protein
MKVDALQADSSERGNPDPPPEVRVGQRRALGIPLLFCRRLSYDQADSLIEISDAWYPADRTELRFVTPLRPWPSAANKRKK